jgi:uncharacterized protein
METSTSTQPGINYVAPIAQKDRILFLDCVRGMALLGILIMNITAQGQAYLMYDSMDVRHALTGLNFYAWGAEMLLFEGTMRGLFSILFGAGTLLLINRLQKNNSGLLAADIYYRRLLWLLVFGLINAFLLLWPGDILYPYALTGLLLFPFRNLTPKKLLIAALIVLAIGTYKDTAGLYERKDAIKKGRVAEQLIAQKKTLTDEQKESLGKWTEIKKKGTKDSLPARYAEIEKKVVNKNYAQIFEYYKEENIMIQSIGFYNGFWDLLLLFFIGMALFKNGFLVGERSTTTYLITAFACTSVAFYLKYTDLSAMYKFQFDKIKFTENASFGFYQLRRTLQTIGYLSLIYKSGIGKKILGIFAPVGQMAFTNYLSQSIITSIIFYGLGYFSKLQRYELYYVVFGIWIFQIIFSTVWLKKFKMGPLEWLWRSLTYWKKQPMRKEA